MKFVRKNTPYETLNIGVKRKEIQYDGGPQEGEKWWDYGVEDITKAIDKDIIDRLFQKFQKENKGGPIYPEADYNIPRKIDNL